MRRPELTEFDTRDPERARAQIEQAYAGHHFAVTDDEDGFEYKHRRIDMGGVRIDRLSHTSTLELAVDAPGYPMVARVLSGRLTSTTEGVPRELGAGDVCLVARPQGHHVHRLSCATLEVVSVDPRIFARLDAASVERLDHLGVDPLDASAAQVWAQAVAYVAKTTADDVAGESPLVLAQAGRLLAATLIALFDREEGAGVPSEASSTSETVQRAVEFIEADPTADIGVEDIAAASHVTARALQLAFRRHLDTTPMAYVRRVRLQRLHQELRHADPADGATVTAAAARWGFQQMGRLSAQYRDLFGESPRDTLHRP